MNEGDVDSALNVWTQELDVRRAVYGAGHWSCADVLNRVGIIRLEKDEFELVSDLLVIDMPWHYAFQDWHATCDCIHFSHRSTIVQISF